MSTRRTGWVEGGVGYIPLTQGYVTLVDEQDFPLVSRYAWSIHRAAKGIYARGCVNGKRVYLHRFLKPLITAEECVDHDNRNSLDNRKANLRIATIQQNNQNKSRSRNNRSGTPGVNFYRAFGKWRAYIGINYSQLHLGFFDTKEEAIEARKLAVLQSYGAFANA